MILSQSDSMERTRLAKQTFGQDLAKALGVVNQRKNPSFYLVFRIICPLVANQRTRANSQKSRVPRTLESFAGLASGRNDTLWRRWAQSFGWQRQLVGIVVPW